MEKIWFIDGACSGNPGPGGWAAVELEKNLMGTFITRELSNYENFTTNNRMELTAILAVCKLADQDPTNQYKIYSDSAYAVNICNDWIWKWAANGWTRGKGKRIENLSLIQSLYNILKKDFCNCEIIKVSGHKGNIGNELADAIASQNKVKEKNIKLQYNINHIDFS